jgi:hypothetical protein
MPEDLGALFGGVVVPEATPSPRTIRFATPPLGDGPSRAFTRDDAADDPPVARLFAVSAEVTNVLVGPTFVAVTVARPDAWESLLASLLEAVTTGFAGEVTGPQARGAASTAGPGPGGPVVDHEPRRLETAWRELGTATGSDDHDARVVAATRADEAERRQVAAVLLADLAADVAAEHWARLVEDPSRSVRRATVDTVGDARREELRPLLETALGDADPWIRWRALRGIGQLGADASHGAVARLAEDPDFRVRLEAARTIAG